MSLAEILAVMASSAAVITVAITGLVIVAKVGRMAGIMETTLTNQNMALSEMKAEIKALASVVTQQAVQNNRLSNVEQQVLMLQKQIDELRHGEGWIFPSPIPKTER